ncbi:MAG: alpha/beta fold hydrolase [Vicinamibacterales bacterium]|jgi:predicted esterase
MANHLDPHAGQPVLHRGAAIAGARLAAILVHGRGASAEDILGLSEEFSATDVAFLAPRAAGATWYPYSFLAPIAQNEPYLGSALGVIAAMVDQLAQQGLPADRVVLMGFSQGACLASEFAARHARRYAGLAALSGGLIGPPGTARVYAGAFDGTPVFMGCSDVDPHIPVERVRESAEVFRRMGAVVDERIYPGMGHTVSRNEIEAVNTLLAT